MLIGSNALPVAFFGFITSFLMINRRRWLILGFAVYIIGEISNAFGLIIQNSYLQNGRLIWEIGPLAFIPSFVVAFFMIFSSYEMIKAYRNSHDYLFRNRLKYLMMVIATIFIGNITNLTNLKYYPGDVAFNILAAGLMTIALLRHRLLDFSLVLRRILFYAIPTLIIGFSYYLVILFATKIKSVPGPQLFLLSLVVAMISALLITPLRNLVQTFIDGLFFREKHDSSQMLQRISSLAAFVLDIDEITHLILDELNRYFHIDHAAFFLKRPEVDEFYSAYQKGLRQKVEIHWNSHHPIVQSLSSFDHPLTRHDLTVSPQFRDLSAADREVLENIWAELLIPLKVKGELVGIFSLGPKRSKEVYTDEDQLTLMTLSNQIAVAIENARLFSSEQSRRAELDTLYRLSRQLVAIDVVDEILQTTISYIVKSVNVTFARALILNEKNELVCRAAYPIRALDYDLRLGKVDPDAALPYYMNAVMQAEPVVISRGDPSITATESKALMLDKISSLCLTPLRVGDQALGLIALGERRDASRESFDANKLRLICSISDQTASALRRARLHEQIESNFLETVLALANAMDARDTYTINHSQRLAAMAETICNEMGRSEEEVRVIRWAALLHDLGKIGVPDEILRKPGPLTDDEWIIMKKHPEIGARIVAPIRELAAVAPLIRAHQERYDGSGYPDGLKGEQIPFGARLLAIIDAYGAMTDDRVYRKTRTPAEALQELIRCKGTHFDPDLVDHFVELKEKSLLLTEPAVRSVDL